MTDASKVLNVSHSAVSQSIKSLESQVGQTLFRRVGRHVELNGQGKRYYRKVAPALEQIMDATEALQKPEHPHRLTLNLINSLALHWWIPRMPDFQQLAPHLDVRISNLVEVFNLEKEGVDIALIHGKKNDWENYHCEKLGDDELVMVCSPDIFSDTKNVTSLLKRFPAIYASNDRRKNDWQVWCDAHQLPIPKQQNSLSFNSSVHAVQAAIRKLGVFVTHRLFVKDDIKHGLLVEMGSPVKNPYQSFYLACPADKLKLESVLTLRQWLKSEFDSL